MQILLKPYLDRESAQLPSSKWGRLSQTLWLDISGTTSSSATDWS